MPSSLSAGTPERGHALFLTMHPTNLASTVTHPRHFTDETPSIPPNCRSWHRAIPGSCCPCRKESKTYRTALIGSGWWGMNILREAMKAGNTKVVALCDVDRDKLEIATVATPDHWHALNTIAAIEAGAHIFVEKPTGHTIGESRARLAAARANDRVVQVGLHRRIGPHYRSGMKFLKAGNVGDIGMVKACVHSNGGVEKPTPNSPTPEQVDWDIYCGPAPLRPFNRKIHPGGFRNFLDFANGQVGDWRVHWMDQISWWTDELGPLRIHSVVDVR